MFFLCVCVMYHREQRIRHRPAVAERPGWRGICAGSTSQRYTESHPVNWKAVCEGNEKPFHGCLELTPLVIQCQKIGKIVTGPTYKLRISFTAISDVYRLSFQIKLHLLNTVLLLSGFQCSWALWHSPNTAVPGKFQWSGGHSNHNCFHRSRAWQIVLVFDTGYMYSYSTRTSASGATTN